MPTRRHRFALRLRERAITPLVAGLIALGVSVPLLVGLASDVQDWLGYRHAHSCGAWWDTTNCWTESPAAVLEKRTKVAGRGMPYTTEFVLGIGVSTRSTVEIPGRFTQPIEGDLTLVRVWDNGDVIAVGDGSQWFDTFANPRIVLPRSIGFVGLALGMGIGFLLAALALRRSTGGWIRQNEAATRTAPLWAPIGVVFLVPWPAFLVAVYWFGQPVWMPLALDAGAAAVGVAGILLARRVRSGQVVDIDSPAPDASSSDRSDPYRWPMD